MLDVLRRLLNILDGSMSLVGGRPPHPREIAHMPHDALRGCYCKLDMTGLRQFSERSEPDETDSVQLNLRHVRNWSLSLLC